ncbi:hypothetical protein ANO11243_029400 [Dothideomycetidae sp. 11243]|nr:hypothetical protein ANO11243_029400 [fungal sp. No.11243]
MGADAAATSHLLCTDESAFSAATQHPWLRLVGQGRLPASAQLAWLKQDRLYALSYVSFIGGLLAKVTIPTGADRTSTLEWRIAATLIDALVGIKRELAMFEDVLRDEFGWGTGSGKAGSETVQPEPPTARYQQLFADASSPACPLIVGLTALWATEKCYLEAWRFAKRQQPDGSEDVFHRTLIPNWTSPDFEAFVEALRCLVDDSAARPDTTRQDREAMENMWRRILEVERDFWPSVDERED